MKFIKAAIRPLASLVLFLGILPGAGSRAIAGAAPARQDGTQTYHSAIPAGYDAIVLKPSGAIVSLLGLIECPELEGVQHVAQGMQARIAAPDGSLLKNFPRNFSFRITASLRKTVLLEPALAVASAEDPRDFLLKLKFKLRVYDGLNAREIPPRSVSIIGAPPEAPYDERIYRLSFEATDIQVSGRMVLDVLSPRGERLTRFHFELL